MPWAKVIHNLKENNMPYNYQSVAWLIKKKHTYTHTYIYFMSLRNGTVINKPKPTLEQKIKMHKTKQQKLKCQNNQN